MKKKKKKKKANMGGDVQMRRTSLPDVTYRKSFGLSGDTYRELLEAVKNGENQVSLPIPYSAVSSYQGSLIEVTHHVTIKARTPFGSTDPKIKVPLQIVSPNTTQGQFQYHPEPTALEIQRMAFVPLASPMDGRRRRWRRDHYQEEVGLVGRLLRR